MDKYSFNDLVLASKNDNQGQDVRLAVLGDSSTQLLVKALRGMGNLSNVNFQIYEADYDQIDLQIIDKNSGLHSFDPEFIYIHFSPFRFLEEYNKSATYEERAKMWQKRLDRVKNLVSQLETRVLISNLPEIDDKVFGNYSNKFEGSAIYQFRRLNIELIHLASGIKNLSIVDLASIQSTIGRDLYTSDNVYITADLDVSPDALPLVVDSITTNIRTSIGLVKKCLILDLDNTTWGGIIGDDGLEGIQIGKELGIGKAFYEFQYWVKKLKERGIILAVCSKNTDSIAREPFEKHSSMVLSLADIAVFVANWENKADNIRYIQNVLNIGFDSMVFLDDNPMERQLVKANLPDIIVPDLPEDPAQYLSYLYSLNLFDTTTFSTIDKDRTRQYQMEAQRVENSKKFTDLDGFLKSLCMTSEVKGLTDFNLPRVEQLLQRSNQFNLTTKRYSSNELESMKDSGNYEILTFTLDDVYGSNGLISVVILEDVGDGKLFIDTWIMSCRVLKRGVEKFVLNEIIEVARRKNCKEVLSIYKRTAKNKLVEEHYDNLGFELLDNSESEKKYSLVVEKYQKYTFYINN